MNDEDKNKVTLALANSFLQTATLQQTLQIVQEKALERAKEEVESMNEEQMEEILTSIKAQEIAQDLKKQKSGETETPDNEVAKTSKSNKTTKK